MNQAADVLSNRGPTNGPRLFLTLAAAAYVAALAALLSLGQYSLLAYLAVATTCVVVFMAPTQYGLALFVFFASVAGFLKEVTNYATAVHLANDLVYGCLLLGFGFRCLFQRQSMWVWADLGSPIAILWSSAVLLSFAPWTTPLQAAGGWKAYVLPALLVPVAAVTYSVPGRLRPLLIAIIAAGTINSIASIIELQIGPHAIGAWGGPGFAGAVGPNSIIFDVTGHSGWRPFGLTQDAGTAVAVEALAVIVVAALAARARRGRVLLLALLPVPLAGVVLSGVRVGIVMTLAGVLGVLLMRERGGFGRNASRALVVAATAGLAALVLFTSAPFLVRERATTLTDPATLMGARGFLVAQVAPFLVQHPLGAGMGKIVPAGQLLSTLAGVAPDAYASENMLYAMSVELGVMGAAFVLAFWYILGRGAMRRIRQGAGSQQSEIGFVVCIAFAASAFAGPLIVAQPGNLLLWIFATAALLKNAGDPPDR